MWDSLSFNRGALQKYDTSPLLVNIENYFFMFENIMFPIIFLFGSPINRASDSSIVAKKHVTGITSRSIEFHTGTVFTTLLNILRNSMIRRIHI